LLQAVFMFMLVSHSGHPDVHGILGSTMDVGMFVAICPSVR